jgi:hypothetical protein
MKQPEIESLIQDARAQHLWLRSMDDPDVWFTLSKAEAAGSDLWLSPNFILGFTLADPHLLLDAITDDIAKSTLEYEGIQKRIAAG